MRTATLALIFRELSFGQSTAAEIAQALGLHRRTIARRLARAAAEDAVHVTGWERSKGRAQPVYAPGTGPQRKPPQPLTAAQKQHRYRERRQRYPLWGRA